MLRGALKAGVAAKAISILRREAAKPSNQQKARELLSKAGRRGGPTRRP